MMRLKKLRLNTHKDGDVYKLDSISEQERSELNDILKNTMNCSIWCKI